MFSSFKNLLSGKSSNEDVNSEQRRATYSSPPTHVTTHTTATTTTPRPSLDTSSPISDWTLEAPKALLTVLEEELQCPICLELFDNPIILACNHTLCHKHISEIQLRSDEAKVHDLICPICRKKCSKEEMQHIRSDSLRNRIISGLLQSRKDAASQSKSPTPRTIITSPHPSNSSTPFLPSPPPVTTLQAPPSPISLPYSSSSSQRGDSTQSFAEILTKTVGDLSQNLTDPIDALTQLKLLQSSIENMIQINTQLTEERLSRRQQKLRTMTHFTLDAHATSWISRARGMTVQSAVPHSISPSSEIRLKDPNLALHCERSILKALTDLQEEEDILPSGELSTLQDQAMESHHSSGPHPTPFPASSGYLLEEDAPPDGVYIADRSVPGLPLATSWCLAGTADAIAFRVSEPIRLVGIGLYGGQGQYDCRTAVRRDTTELQSQTLQFTSNDTSIVKVMFPTSVVIEPNVVYVVSALLTGWGSWYCKSCSPNLSVRGGGKGDVTRVEFTFVDAPPPSNGTKVDGGQIPALYFKFL